MEDWPIVVELLAAHDDNLKKVESLALREIYSIEVPVFNGLRDILPFSILAALRRMDYCFGKDRTIEHALYLVALTDYISCAYNQRNFYRTFENALTAKFVNSLFETLYTEWSKVFSGRPLIHFTDCELESIQKSLSRSVDRFPESFRHKFLLNHIVLLGSKYHKRLTKKVENVGVNLPKIQRPLMSSENLLRKDKCPGESNNFTNSGQKKHKADLTKYFIKKPVHKEPTNNFPLHKESINFYKESTKKPVHKEPTNNVPLHKESTNFYKESTKKPVQPTNNISLHKESTNFYKESTKNVPVASQKPVTNVSVASYTEHKAQTCEKLAKLDEDDSMDSVDIYLTRRSVYTPYGQPDNGDIYDATDSKSRSPIESFFEEMKRLNDCAIEVSDSDEETMKVNVDSNYSEISVEEKFSTNWCDALEADEGKMNAIDFDSKPTEVKIEENSAYSSLTFSDDEKPNTNCDYVPDIVSDGEKNSNYQPSVTDEEKMNIANNNSSPVKDTVVSICDCCTTKTDHTSRIPVPSVAKKKLNAFDILMKKVVPPKRKRFSK